VEILAGLEEVIAFASEGTILFEVEVFGNGTQLVNKTGPFDV
jgi:hypothetical protein